MEAAAKDQKVAPSCLQIWKPRVHLPNNPKARYDLETRLSQHESDFSRFCEDLSEHYDDTIDILFDYQNRRGATRTALVAEIQRQPQAKPSTSLRADKEGEEAEDVLTVLINNFHKAVNLSGRPTPSVGANPPQYLKHQDGGVPILDGRYGEKQCRLIAPPIEVYHPAFAAFVANASNQSLTVPEEIIQSTAGFMEYVSKISTNESHHGETRTWLSKLFSAAVSQSPNKNRTSADHVVLHDRTSDPFVLAALAIVEEKSELGQSGEPSVQGSFSYVEFWTEGDRSALLKSCFCPSFIIAVSGPWMAVCGAIFTTHPIVHRLTDYIWLGHSRAIDDHRTLHLARVLYSLRIGIASLRKYYDELLVTPDNATRRFFPLATSCRLDDGEQLRFRYLCPLKGADPSCVTFLVADRADAARRLVVKFVERYGAAAHRLLAAHGRAPQLLFCGPVWSTDAVPGGGALRMMVVMEHLEGTTAAEQYYARSRSIPQAVRDAVHDALGILHAHGFVHGDIRLPNIMIEGDMDDEEDIGKRTKLVDFDWAGIQGEVRYPLHLTANAGWVDGVADYALIEASHDQAMAGRLR